MKTVAFLLTFLLAAEAFVQSKLLFFREMPERESEKSRASDFLMWLVG